MQSDEISKLDIFKNTKDFYFNFIFITLELVFKRKHLYTIYLWQSVLQTVTNPNQIPG